MQQNNGISLGNAVAGVGGGVGELAPGTIGGGVGLEGGGRIITLGDLLQKITMKSYEEIKLTVEAFPAQSPELRGEKLAGIINKAKKRFAQLYALLIWLNEEHVRQYLQSTSDLKFDVNEQIGRLNVKQDAFFYIHSSLYGKRIKSLEIQDAYEMLSEGTFSKLPSAISHCRKVPTPSPIDRNIIITRLETLIRAKLFLSEEFPVKYDSVKFVDGMLMLTLSHYYEIVLSLAHLKDYEAPWTIISVQILTHNHERERLQGDSDPREINAGVLKILMKVVKLPNCKNQLFQIHRVCMYAAQSQTLRLLYVQALDMTRTSLIGIAEATYVETTDRVAFRCLFWKVKPPEIDESMRTTEDLVDKGSEYLYELSVSLLRPSHSQQSTTQSVSALTFEVKEVSSQTTLYHVENLSSSCETFPIPDGVQYIEKGVSFGALYNSTINLCSCRQLTSLYSLIQISSVFQRATSFGLRLIGPENTAKISLTLESSEVMICVNAKDGSFIVSAISLASVLGGNSSQGCELLQLEINERYRTGSTPSQTQKSEPNGWEESKGDSGGSGSGGSVANSNTNTSLQSTGELINLDPVIHLILLSVTSQHAHAQLGIASLKSLQIRNPLSLHFPLTSWIDNFNSTNDASEAPVTKKRHALAPTLPQFCRFDVFLEIRMDPITLEQQYYFCLCQSPSVPPLKMESNHFISQIQSFSSLLPPTILSSRPLSSPDGGWYCLPVDDILHEIRAVTPIETLKGFIPQFPFLSSLNEVFSSIPSHETTCFFLNLPIENYYLHLIVSFTSACFLLVPSNQSQSRSQDLNSQGLNSKDEFLHLILTIPQHSKLTLFESSTHRLSVSFNTVIPNSIWFCSDSINHSTSPALLGLPLLHISHFFSHQESLGYWCKHSPVEASPNIIPSTPLSLKMTHTLTSMAQITLTFVPSCFSLIPIQSPIINSPLSLFSIEFSKHLSDHIGKENLPLFSQYCSAVIGLSLQEIFSPASLSPMQYLSSISQEAAPLIDFLSSSLHYFSHSSTTPVVWKNFTLWSLDYAILDLKVNQNTYSILVKRVKTASSEGIYSCSLDSQQTIEISLSEVRRLVDELILSQQGGKE